MIQLFERSSSRAYSVLATVIEVIGAIIAVGIGFGYMAAPIFFQTNSTAEGGWDLPARTVFGALFLAGLAIFAIGLIYLMKK